MTWQIIQIQGRKEHCIHENWQIPPKMYQIFCWILLVSFCSLSDTNTASNTSVITDEQIDDVLGSVIHRLLVDDDNDEYVEEVLSNFIQLLLKTMKMPELCPRFLERTRVLIAEEINKGQCGEDCVSCPCNDDGDLDSNI